MVVYADINHDRLCMEAGHGKTITFQETVIWEQKPQRKQVLEEVMKRSALEFFYCFL